MSRRHVDEEVAAVDECINRIVADWPQISDERLDRIAALLRSGKGKS